VKLRPLSSSSWTCCCDGATDFGGLGIHLRDVSPDTRTSSVTRRREGDIEAGFLRDLEDNALASNFWKPFDVMAIRRFRSNEEAT